MFNSELAIRTNVSGNIAASMVPCTRSHLLQLPPVGGRPMMLMAPMKKHAIVMGIFRPMPSMSLISVL